MEQIFPLSNLGNEFLKAVRVTKWPEHATSNLVWEREFIFSEHVDMLVEQRSNVHSFNCVSRVRNPSKIKLHYQGFPIS